MLSKVSNPVQCAENNKTPMQNKNKRFNSKSSAWAMEM